MFLGSKTSDLSELKQKSGRHLRIKKGWQNHSIAERKANYSVRRKSPDA
jgi:hypothetical protein